jgi:ankyrin repeat protein
MIRPPELASDAWEALSAAAAGDVETLRRQLARDPDLHRREYWYTPPLYFAVREGHEDAVRLLLEAGADPATVCIDDQDLAAVARDRGHEAVARLIDGAIVRARRTLPDATRSDHAIHAAADRDDVAAVGQMLDGDASLVHRGDRQGGTPLHRAAAASARRVVELLLDRGADLHALHGSGPGSPAGYAAAGFQPIDMALWNGPYYGVRGDIETARLLLARGAAYDTVIAAALGDLARVTALLDEDPARLRETRPSGKRALSSAVQFGREAVVRLLLARGADPNWPEGTVAPRGTPLHVAARAGQRALVELLLAHGADPNAHVDSSGNATYAARTPELRELLLARGGTLSTYDLVWLDEDDEVVRRVAADPRSADEGCGGVLAAACRQGKRDLLVRLLAAGARVPPMLTACRSYLLSDPDLLRLLLASGMDPDLPNWLWATPLHDLCGRDGRGRPRPHRLECAAVLLEAGARISARDEDYRSTPLGWAARNDLADMVEMLLARGAPTNLPDDQPWATPLAWALRRGHAGVADLLRRAGATA